MRDLPIDVVNYLTNLSPEQLKRDLESIRESKMQGYTDQNRQPMSIQEQYNNGNVAYSSFYDVDDADYFPKEISTADVVNFIKKKKMKLTEDEMNLLRFCHDTDMHKMLNEEFTLNNIELNSDGTVKNPDRWFDNNGTIKKDSFIRR